MFLFTNPSLSNIFNYDEVICYFSNEPSVISKSAQYKQKFWESFPTYVLPGTIKFFLKYFEMPLFSYEEFNLIKWMELPNPLAKWDGLLADNQDLRMNQGITSVYPIDYSLSDAMEQRTPQFFLRNIKRVRRNEEEFLPFEPVQFFSRDWYYSLKEVRAQKHEPPEFIDELLVEEVKRYRSRTIKWFFQTDWTYYFSRELKHIHGRNLWTHNVNQAE